MKCPRHLPFRALAPAVLLALTAGLLPGQFPQQEFPIAVTEGQEPVSLAAGEYTTGARIDTSGDVDSYSFLYTQGEALRIIVRKLDGATGADPRMRIIENATGTFVPGFDLGCNGNSSPGGIPIPCTLQTVFGAGMSPPATGAYTLLISDTGSNEPLPAQAGQAYRVHLEREPGLTPPEMGYGVQVTDTIAPVTDVDSVLFPAVAGSIIDLQVSQFTGSLDPHVRVFDPMGNVIADQLCSGNSSPGGVPIPCSFTIPLMPTLTGDHVIVISDSGHEETGTYNLTLQCLFSPTGTCPSTPQPLTLSLTQPLGAGTILVENLSGLPGADYVTVFSVDPANLGPASGWWGGLHVSIPELLFQLNLGVAPFVGTLDAQGDSAWAFNQLPPSLPTLWGVTRTFTPGLGSISETSARAGLDPL